MNEQAVNKSGSKPGKKRNLKPFWILLAISGLPYLFSWIYFANMDSMPTVATSNRGSLIEPVRSVEGLSLQLLNGETLQTDALTGNWTLVTAGSSQCDELCEKNIYYLRQVIRLMGEERERIRRLFVLTDVDQLPEFTSRIEAYGSMDVVAGSSADKNSLLESMTNEGASPENRIFIIDPQGNLMMVYEPDSNPVDIAKDFKRLLKVVRIGQPKAAG